MLCIYVVDIPQENENLVMIRTEEGTSWAATYYVLLYLLVTSIRLVIVEVNDQAITMFLEDKA